MAAQKQILVLIKGLGIGGAERLVSEGARFWDREAFEYSVAYALPWKDQLVSALESHGVDVTLIGGERGLDPALPTRLRSLIRERQIDLVHAHLPSMGIAARAFSPVPVVYTEHNVTDSYHPLTRTVNRLTYARNRAVIAVSDAVAESISSWPGPSPLVIRNGVSVSVGTKEAESVRAELGLGDETKLIVHVGNIRPGKGHDVLINAVADLASRRSDFVAISIGAEKYDGNLERVRVKAADAGLADQLRFLGRRPDALSFIAAADVFVNPSEVEGLPLVVLEAMALSRPVVATAAGGVPTIVQDQATGLLVRPSHPQELADGLERLLSDQYLGESLGKAAKALVDEEYGLEPMVRATEDVYRGVLDD